jgi:hypothetical protein
MLVGYIVGCAHDFMKLIIFILLKRRKVLLAHGHQRSLHFWIFENFKTQHFYGSKNYGFKYIERYMQEEHTQKSPVKKYFIFWQI